MAQVAQAISSSVPTRRRPRSETPTVRKSVTLHADILRAAEVAVDAGGAANLSAFVEEAVEEKLRRSKRSQLYAAYAEAARDPAFMAEMREVTLAFDATTGDGLRDA